MRWPFRSARALVRDELQVRQEPESKAAKAEEPTPAKPRKPSEVKPKPAAPSSAPAKPPAKTQPAPVETAPPPPAAAVAVTAEPRPPAGLSVGVSQRRLETFVAGNRQEWSAFDIFVEWQ